MVIKKTCDKCNGVGYYEALINQYSDETETIICDKCKGKKVIYEMTDIEEQNYHENYW